MDCNIFRKRLYDLLEDNLSYDLRGAMLEHIKGCEACSALYKEELEIDEMFKAGLYVDTQDFRSVRSNIIENIDKNRYGVSVFNRLIKHFKNYMGTYTSVVTIIAVFVFLIPYVRTHELVGVQKAVDMQSAKSSLANGTQSNPSLSSSAVTKDALGIANEDKSKQVIIKALNDINYIPQFEKKLLDKDIKVIFNTPWEYSSNKIYGATVEGKGSEAQEEGIAHIVLKNLNNGQQWSFNLIDNQKQFSPKVLHFVDDENLLVVVGFGYGTVRQGGRIYLLNINTGLIAKVDPQNTANIDDKSEITKIKSVKLQDANMLRIDVEVLVYEDDTLNKNHIESRTIISPFNEIIKNIKQ